MSTRPVTIYTAADIGAHLGVSAAVVANWARRHADAPTPDYVTPGGRAFWSDAAEWHAWRARRAERRAERAAAEAARRAAEAEAAAEAARRALAEAEELAA